MYWHRCFALFFTVLTAATSLAGAPTLPQGMRLGDEVVPRAYQLHFTVDPARSEFEGEGSIDVMLHAPRQRIWINAHQLAVSGAEAEVAGRKVAASVLPGDDQVIGLSFAETLPAGPARLSMRWRASLASVDTRGAFRQKEGGAWYAYTQFQALSARRAFPCFDEPHWKTPWQIALTVREAHLGFSNAPLLRESAAQAGWKKLEFAATPALPSYLVAFAVGPFEVLDGGTAGKKQTPLRFIVPRGHGDELAYAREVTPRILDLLEDYFGTPYPFAKLDSLVIPHTVGFAAMENAALITYTSAAILARREVTSERFKQRYATLAAHEIAHQWFGNWVTMAWWDDLWLNESFATWLAERIVDQFAPEWYWPLRVDDARRQAIEVDRLPSTRKVRQPVLSRDDLANAFDRITYQKGGAVLATFEAWLGPERFRDGVRRYLARHPWGNATAEDFFAALAHDDVRVAKAFSGFIEHPGLPLIDLRSACENDVASVALQQTRFVPRGLSAPAQAPWATPLCLRWQRGEAQQSQCTLLEGAAAQLTLAGSGCAEVLLANPGGASYAVTRHAPEALRQILTTKDRLSAAEAIALLHDAELLLRSGHLPLDEALAVFAWGAARPELPVLAVAAESAQRIPPIYWGDPKREARWILQHFGASARQIGWSSKPDEPGEAEQLRMNLLPLVAERGSERTLRQEARRLARTWLKRRAGLEAAAVEPVLRSAARFGDRALFDEYLKAARRARDRNERRQIVSAMGLFPGPAGKAFRLALRTGKLDAREGLEALELALGEAANRRETLHWIEREFLWLKNALPQDILARVPRWANGACTAAERDLLARLWSPRTKEFRGAPRTLALALETIDACIAARPAEAS